MARPGVSGLVEGLDVVEAEITAEGEAAGELEVAAEAVEQCSREVLVEAHIVGTYADDAVGQPVAEPDGGIELRCRSCSQHDIDMGLGIDVDKSDLMGGGVTRIVDDAHLPAMKMVDGYVEQSPLRSAESVGIVV